MTDLPPPAPPALSLGKRRVGPADWVMFGSAVVVVFGSFMPWATAFGGVLSKAGTDGDGTLTLLLAIAAGALALTWSRWWLMLMLTALIGAIALYDIQDVNGTAGVSVGSGLYVVALGSLGLLTGTLVKWLA